MPIAVGLTVGALGYLYVYWLGRTMRKRFDPATLSGRITVSPEQRGTPTAAGVGVARAGALHPVRYLILGTGFSIGAAVAWAIVILS